MPDPASLKRARSRRFAAPLVLTGLLTCSALAALAAPTPPAPKVPVVPADHAERMTKGMALFSTTVRPVLVQQCLKCHGGEKKLGGFDLGTREALLTPNAGRVAIVPGNSGASRLMRLLNHQEQPHMPLGGAKLKPEEIRQIAAWIDLDAPYDRPLVARAAPKGPMVVTEKDRNFWAYRPLTNPTPPVVKAASVVRTPLDRFVLARLEAKGLTLNAPLDPRRLIRRAYFDLTGLPPTPDEVEAFVREVEAENRQPASLAIGSKRQALSVKTLVTAAPLNVQRLTPNAAPSAAYDRLIDRLLASPHYGERWGRHWLDLARFAESHGYEQDYDRPTAYHYRDFVIKALNQDLPYQTFVKWQIAGDEYEPENPLALAATGFLAAGVHSTQITASQVEKERYDELDDQLRTVGTSMLGLTVGCARCHDHKYDPIPTRDYYRMLSTFTRTVRSDYEVDLDPAAYQAAKAKFERERTPLVEALKSYEERELPGKLQGWLATHKQEAIAREWLAPEVQSSRSQGGAIFTPQPDGSLLAGGKNVDNDVYTFVLRTELRGIRSLRLEALAHPSLVKGGPGRADNGNIALSDFRVTAAPVSAPTQATPVKLLNARATFEQPGLPVAAAVDGNRQSAWALDPQFGKDHAAVFELEKPLGFEGGTLLTLTLEFNNNVRHSIGRPRLSLSTVASSAAVGEPVAESVERARARLAADPGAELPAGDRAALLRWYRTQDAGWRDLNAKLDAYAKTEPKPQLTKMLISSEGVAAVRTHTQGGDFLEQTHFLKRGDPNQKAEVMTQGFLSLLTRTPEGEKHWQTPPPAGWRTTYQRRAFAEWMTDVDQGAGHLLARVIVNRMWQHHFGRGIVGTPSDFGVQGERPTHPELLDYLASELIRNGWRLKPIHKLIMSSAVYLQNGDLDPKKAAVDPANHLFGRQAPRRLEAEVIRDAMLSVSGTLDEQLFGPGTLDPAMRRRSIYFFVKRSRMVPSMVLFDGPDTLQGLDRRTATTVAPQALLLMNNTVFRSYADALARRAYPAETAPLAEAIRTAYRMALSRPPSARELAEAVQFVEAQAVLYATEKRSSPRQLALGDFCQVLLGTNEFVYVD
jgi:mono/diheme cytochrome c family protein